MLVYKVKIKRQSIFHCGNKAAPAENWMSRASGAVTYLADELMGACGEEVGF